MGVIIPQVLTEDRASGAQIVDGSLRFNGTNQYLTRTFSTPTSSTLYTFSFWVKRSLITSSTDYRGILSATNAADNYGYIDFSDNGIRWANRPPSGTIGVFQTTPVYRDASAWYHMCLVYDSAQATDANKVKLYVNNTQVTTFGTFTAPSSSQNSIINSAITHYIGYDSGNTGYFSGLLSQVYLIDGQALGPEYFGYTDPLTNTWRPKKLDITKTPGGSYGTNGFYLPLDGNTPIGQDQSGRGNNWTPVNFGGSNTLEKATGAFPILNTDGGGKVARVGVRTDSNYSNLTLALPLVGSANDVSNQINSGSSTKTVTVTNAVASSAASNFYGGSYYFDGTDDYLSIPSNSDFAMGTGDFTVEYWAYYLGYGPTVVVAATNGLWIGNNNGFNLRAYGIADLVTAPLQPLNKWVHIAVTREGTTARIFFDGALQASATTSQNFAQSTLYIGGDGVTETNVYIQDLRIYKGLAKYTQNFIPASTDPDILPDTPSGVAYSSNVTAITDGAVTFDGSGDYLTSTESSDEYDFPNSDWTIEYFSYCTSEPTDAASFSNTKSFASGYRSIIVNQNSGNLSLLVNTTGSGGWTTVGTTTNSLNIWRHIALVRNSGTITFYVDGNSIGSTTDTPYDTVNNDTVYFGRNGGDGSGYFSGFISNARIIKGTALYTSNFTPPTAPITSVENTKLLCCKSNSNPKLADSAPNIGITTNTQFNTNFETIPTTVNGISITNNGSVSTTSAGTNSFGFTNGANFTGSNSLTANIGTVPALSTIDLIFKVNGTTDNKYLFGMSGNGLVRRSSSNLAWYNGSSDQTIYTSPDDGAWHHLRVTPTDLYFDGTRIQNTGSLANINNQGVAGNNGGLMAIGAYRDSTQTTYNGAVIFGLVRIMPGVDLGAPTIPITTNGTLSGSEIIPNDGVIIRNGNAAATNFNPFTANINTQRGQESGYATLNPLANPDGTLSNGNLTWSSTTTQDSACASTIYVNSGKWYWEITDVTGTGALNVGISKDNDNLTPTPGTTAGGYYYLASAYKYNNNSISVYGSTWTTGDVISAALDMDAGTVTFYKNGISQGVAYSGLSGYFSPSIGDGGQSTAASGSINFGQKPFKFPPPAGFQPLAIANTPRPTVVRPDQYVGVTTYAGNGTSVVVNDYLFKPDFVWIKGYTDPDRHGLYDTVRGATKRLQSSETVAEDTQNGVVSFDSNGFTVGNYAETNGSGRGYVAWSWKAGGNSNTYNIDDIGYDTASAAGLTAGTITPTGASINTKSGFSIIKWNGSGASGTISHGLGNTPGLIFLKGTSAGEGSENWRTYHSVLGTSPSNTLFLNLTNASSSNTERISAVGTSTFTLSSGGAGVNASGQSYIAYLWAEIPGFSKFGSYTGTDTSNYIHLGFRPALVIIKNATKTSSAFSSWMIQDAERSPYNPTSGSNKLWANRAIQEGYRGDGSTTTNLSANDIDFDSNGFYIPSSASTETNETGQTFIYAAWAESPSFNLYGGQANAR